MSPKSALKNYAAMAAETDIYQRPPRCAMQCPMIAFSNSCAEEAPQGKYEEKRKRVHLEGARHICRLAMGPERLA